jgi:hypothetical protein
LVILNAKQVQEIKGIARVKFHPGKHGEWKRLTEQGRRSAIPPI